MQLWNHDGKQNSITEALRLDLPERAVISVTGSGGKTSLLAAWGRELAASGKRTVITTTTHMLHPGHVRSDEHDPYSGIPVIFIPDCASGTDITLLQDMDTIKNALEEERLIMAVSPDHARPAKVTAPHPAVMELICDTADAVLIEADGSRRMPLKWPAPWEPVVPEATDITVCVAGLSALGRDLNEVMYRADELPEFLRRNTADEALISAVLSSGSGGRKSAKGEFRVFLNQADDERLRGSAERISETLEASGIISAWGSLLSDQLSRGR